MKLLLLSVALAMAVVLVHADTQWETFKKHHKKAYHSNEEKFRAAIFKERKAHIDAHNERHRKGEVSFEAEVNHFADMLPDEFKNFTGAINQDAQPVNHPRAKRGVSTQAYAFNSTCPTFHMYTADSGLTLPASVDLRTKGWNEPVRNQGSCGSCWAFSSSSVMSYYQFAKTGTNLIFAPQYLVDCSNIWGSKGCNGGSPAQAFEFDQINKQTIETNYPYKGVQATCKTATSSLYGATGFVQISSDALSLKQAVAKLGAVVVSIDATYLQSYKSGIWDGTDPTTKALCSSTPNHAVTLIGYGTDSATGKDYWLIKNSWGTTWGESGYFRMARSSTSLCGLFSYTYALV